MEDILIPIGGAKSHDWTSSVLGFIHAQSMTADTETRPSGALSLVQIPIRSVRTTVATLVGSALAFVAGWLNNWVLADWMIYLAATTAGVLLMVFEWRGRARRESKIFKVLNPGVPTFKDKVVLEALPGAQILVVARSLYSQRTFTQIFEPTAHDLWADYIEALANHQPRRARWIRIRGYWTFVNVMLIHSGMVTVKRLVNIWRTIT